MLDRGREFHLGEWHVMPLRGVLRNGEESRRLTPKAVDVLLCLAEDQGEVVERDALLHSVWGERAVSDEPLTRCIAELRRQLGDERSAPRFIETIPKRGYRLVAVAESIGIEPPAPSARQRHSQRISGMLIAGLIAFLVVVGVLIKNRPGAETQALKAIAVLPFTVLSSGKRGEYFADGIHEETIARLANIPNLAVRSRSSTIAYRGSALPVQRIAAELDADVIVEGSVRQEADLVRVTVQLIDTATDDHLWAHSFEKQLTVANLFAIQREIADAVANALSLSVPAADNSTERLPTSSIAAYDDFLLGKYHYRRQLPGDIEASVGYFESASRQDPEFAQAWDWLAYAYNHAATPAGYLLPADAYPKARAAALRALEIAPDLSTALALLGYIRGIYDRDWVGAEADLRRAIALGPDDTGTVWSLAHILSILGRHSEAVALTRALVEKKPTSGRRHREVANRLIDAGEFDAALATLANAPDSAVSPGSTDDAVGVALFALGRFDDAVSHLEAAADARQRAPATLARLAAAYAHAGRQDDAVRLLDELTERAQHERISALTFATAFAGLGRTTEALDQLALADVNRERGVLGIESDPFLSGLRDEPAFQRLVQSFGRPK